MTIAQRLLALTAKTAVDRLTGSPERTNDYEELFKEWRAERKGESVNDDVAEAKREASDQAALNDVINQALAENGQVITPQQREALKLSLAASFSSLPTQVENGEAAVKLLSAQLDRGKKTYVIYLDDPAIIGANDAGRYCHFSYDGDSYRVRDYLSNRIFHPASVKVSGKEWNPVALNMSALEIWNTSKGQIRCTLEYGLSISIDKGDEWRRILKLLTETAKRFQQL